MSFCNFFIVVSNSGALLFGRIRIIEATIWPVCHICMLYLDGRDHL